MESEDMSLKQEKRMYLATDNKFFYLALNRFPKTAKKVSPVYVTGFHTWADYDGVNRSVVLGTFRIIFSWKYAQQIKERKSALSSLWSSMKRQHGLINRISNIVLVTIVLIGGSTLIIRSVNRHDDYLKLEILSHLSETSYADGQRDALIGDVRIKILSDSQVVFTKSPWDDCADTYHKYNFVPKGCMIPETLNVEKHRH
jgi:hypothetical protein